MKNHPSLVFAIGEIKLCEAELFVAVLEERPIDDILLRYTRSINMLRDLYRARGLGADSPPPTQPYSERTAMHEKPQEQTDPVKDDPKPAPDPNEMPNTPPRT